MQSEKLHVCWLLNLSKLKISEGIQGSMGIRNPMMISILDPGGRPRIGIELPAHNHRLSSKYRCRHSWDFALPGAECKLGSGSRSNMGNMEKLAIGR
jgi:hypothetical protein